GVLDDIFEIPAWLKLAGQVGASAVALAWDVQLNVVPNWIPGFVMLNVIVTVLWFLRVTNAIQFLDGMDGLAAGLGVIASIFFSIAALQTGQAYLMLLAAALLCRAPRFVP